MDSWSNEGYFTAVAEGYKKMNEYLEAQNVLLEDYIQQAQDRLPGLYEELQQFTPGTEEYDEVLKRIDLIQDDVVTWTQNLEENKASIKSNEKAIEEMYKKIRDL